MTDYRVTIKVRNARLLRAITNAGYLSIPKFSEAAGVRYAVVNDLINMTVSPLSKSGQITPVVEKIIDFLCEPFDALFTYEQCQALATNKSERDVSAEHVYALTTTRDVDDPLDLLLANETPPALDRMLCDLKDQERLVLTKRYGLDGNEAKTLHAIAGDLSLSQERIRQIEAKALRKLRHPSRHPDQEVRDAWLKAQQDRGKRAP